MRRTGFQRAAAFVLLLSILGPLWIMGAMPARAADYYILGSYPQTEAPETAALLRASYDENNVATVDQGLL